MWVILKSYSHLLREYQAFAVDLVYFLADVPFLAGKLQVRFNIPRTPGFMKSIDNRRQKWKLRENRREFPYH